MTHVQKETAVLLKEKGFDVEVRYRFYENETISEDGGLDNYNRYKHHWISAPTLHEAADWLREVKGVHVAIVPTFGKATWDFQYFIYNNENKCWDLGQIGNYSCDTHDLALESCIIHALKHYIK